jgi:hypothetical protein
MTLCVVTEVRRSSGPTSSSSWSGTGQIRVLITSRRATAMTWFRGSYGIDLMGNICERLRRARVRSTPSGGCETLFV